MITTVILFVLVVIVILGFAFIIYILNQRLQDLRRDSGTALLDQRMGDISKGIGDLRDGLQTSLTQSLQQQFRDSNKIIADVNTRLTKLDETNRRVVDVADELKTLQNVLQNPKQRGGLGEYYLETVLANVLPPGGYEMQYRFKNGEAVDAVIKLDKGRLLPIDSKFSLENYNRIIEAKDSASRTPLIAAFKNDLKNRIDETAKYIRSNEKTLDYAFMFIPSEAIYYDLLANKIGSTGTNARDLIEYAFQDKHVIIVSPTTFMAYLQTVLQGMRSLQIEEQTKEIIKRVSALDKHFKAHESYMHKLGGTLSTTVGHFVAAHKSFGQMDKDVSKITGSTPNVEPLLVEKPRIDTDE